MTDSAIFVLGSLGALLIVAFAIWLICNHHQQVKFLAKRTEELTTAKNVLHLEKDIAERQRKTANHAGASMREERDALALRVATLERLLAAEGFDVEKVPARDATLTLAKRRTIRHV